MFFMAQHTHFHITSASLIKRLVVPSVSSAQDKTRAKHHCQEVYGPGERGHCLHVAKAMMCLRREKMAARTGNDFLDFHPSLFTFGSNTFNLLWRRNACFLFFS